MTGAPRVALFADSLLEVNGVALTCRRLEEHARLRDLPLLVVHPGARTGREGAGCHWRLALGPSPACLHLEADLNFDLLFARHLRLVQRTLREFGAELVHLTGPNHTGFLGALAAWRLRLPVVMSWHTNVHQYAAWRLPRWAPQWLRDAALAGSWRGLALYYRQAKLILAPNREIAGQLEKEAGRPARLMLRGVDCELFHPSKRERTDAAIVAGYVGRLSPEKAVRRLREVALGLSAAGIGAFRVEIAGDGGERPWLEANVPNVRFHGVLRGEALCERVRLGVDDEVDQALPPQRHVLGTMTRDLGEAHRREQLLELLRLRMGVLDELHPVGAHRVDVADAAGGLGAVGRDVHGAGLLLRGQGVARAPRRNCTEMRGDLFPGSGIR